MKRAVTASVLLSLGVVSGLLGGCSLFGGNGIPPEPKILGVTAQDVALRQAIRKGRGGQPDVFVPLVKARAAVEAARAQPGIDAYAADLLAQARDALQEADQMWSRVRDQKERSVDQLEKIQTKAHAARRLAQIARYTAVREINLAELNTARQQEQAAQASGPRLAGTKVVPGQFGAFEFQPGTARLTGDSAQVVNKVAGLLKDNPNVGIVILAYTDSAAPGEDTMRGFKQANPQLEQRNLSREQLVYAYHIALSRARARAVARALVQAGIAPRRIGAKGFGSSRPVASNDTAQGRAANRRVVAVIVKGPDNPGSPLYRSPNGNQ